MSFFSKIAELINETPSNPNMPNSESDAVEGEVRSQGVTEQTDDDATGSQGLSEQEGDDFDIHLFTNFDVRPYYYDTSRAFL